MVEMVVDDKGLPLDYIDLLMETGEGPARSGEPGWRERVGGRWMLQTTDSQKYNWRQAVEDCQSCVVRGGKAEGKGPAHPMDCYTDG